MVDYVGVSAKPQHHVLMHNSNPRCRTHAVTGTLTLCLFFTCTRMTTSYHGWTSMCQSSTHHLTSEQAQGGSPCWRVAPAVAGILPGHASLQACPSPDHCLTTLLTVTPAAKGAFNAQYAK